MAKEKVLVICPGRGSYTKETLGYLRSYRPFLNKFIADLDERRHQIGEPTITELDEASQFKTAIHTKGEHASALIYACAAADFLALDRDRFEVLAVTGNSMGWYLALAFAEGLHREGAFQVIQSMGSMMKEERVGGQMIYPLVDENWHFIPEAYQHVDQALKECNEVSGAQAYISIELGGYIVLAGNRKGLEELTQKLRPVDHYPFQLVNHGAFHTPLLQEVSQKAFHLLPESLFHQPKTYVVDGRGVIWSPYTTDRSQIYHYTLGHQVVCPYSFTKAMNVALKEFNPDRLILLGPGNSLGGVVGQILVSLGWKGLHSKQDFVELQKKNPFLISMGVREQKESVVKKGFFN